MEVSGQLHAFAALPPNPVPIGIEDGCHLEYGRCGEEKTLLSLPKIELQYLSIRTRSLVTISIDLSWIQ
jgi:hypothetical protein